MTQHTDTPSELTEQSDGITDDGAFDEQIIGACSCGPRVGSGLRQHLQMHSGIAGSLQHLSVSGGLGALAVGGSLQHISVAGLGDLAVAGLPSYLFTRKNLSSPVVRRRLAASIKAMTPKLRRRVLTRLRAAVASSRHLVSGEVRGGYPSIAGVGWTGITVAGRSGCPYANVAGALTP